MGSRSTTTQKDNRIVAESGSIVAGPEGMLALAGGLNVSAGNNLSNLSISQHVSSLDTNTLSLFDMIIDSSEKSYAKLMGVTENAMAGVFQQTAEAQKTVKQGESGKYLEYFPYIIVIGIVFLLINFKR